MSTARAIATARGRFSPRALVFCGLCLASVGWAAAFIAGKVVVAEFSPLSAAALRYALASAVLMPFALRSRNPGRVRDVLLPLSAMVLCGGILYPSLFLFALERTSATNTALLVTLNPVLTLLLSPLVGEVLDRRRLIGVGLALSGAIMVITDGDAALLANVARLNPGNLIAVTAAVAWAGFNLAARRVVAQVSAPLTNVLVYGCGGCVLYALAYSEAPIATLSEATPAAMVALAVMAIFSSALAGQFFLNGVRVVGVGRTVVFVYAVPVLTAGFSSLFLGEPFQISQAIGGLGVIAGLLLTAYTPRAQRLKGTDELDKVTSARDGDDSMVHEGESGMTMPPALLGVAYSARCSARAPAEDAMAAHRRQSGP